MKKTLSVLALCLALLLALTACSAQTQTTESPASEAGKNSEGRNVTFVLKNLVNPFCVTVKEGAEQAAKDLNVNLSILTPIQGDNNEELMQLTEQAVASGSCDTIIVFPSDSIGIVPAVKKAYDAKIPVVLLNTGITTDEVIWESFVACENWEVGRACGEALAEKLNYKGKVILIEGVVGAQNSIDRVGGAREVIDAYPDMEIVAVQSGEMNRAKAMEVMQNLLQAHPDVDGVWAMNDEMALGCVEAIADARTAVKEGKLSFTCDLVPFDQGYQAVATAAKILDGETPDDRVVTSMKVIDISNIDDTAN